MPIINIKGDVYHIYVTYIIFITACPSQIIQPSMLFNRNCCPSSRVNWMLQLSQIRYLEDMMFLSIIFSNFHLYLSGILGHPLVLMQYCLLVSHQPFQYFDDLNVSSTRQNICSNDVRSSTCVNQHFYLFGFSCCFVLNFECK